MENSVNYLNILFLNAVRTGEDDEDGGESQFGLVPPLMDPLHMSSQPNASSFELGNLPKPHPLLAKSAQFSGIDKQLTANPTESSAAQERYPQLRLQQQNTLKFGHGKRKVPTPMR